MRVSANKVNPILKKQIEETFIQTLADLKDTKEIKIFLTDFFNQTEMETFTKRLAVAYWLKKQRSYNNIKNNLKVSSATIATDSMALAIFLAPSTCRAVASEICWTPSAECLTASMIW